DEAADHGRADGNLRSGTKDRRGSLVARRRLQRRAVRGEIWQQPEGQPAGPKIVPEALWRAEGFTDVQYERKFATNLEARLGALASNDTDIDATFVGPLISRIDAGDPIVILSGLHAGCFELFGGERVRAIRDLKGKTVAVSGVGGPDHAFVASMLAYVGLDARRDVSWVALPTAESIEWFANGKVDAFMGFPTGPG